MLYYIILYYIILYYIILYYIILYYIILYYFYFIFFQLSEWDEQNVILTGSLDGVVRVGYMKYSLSGKIKSVPIWPVLKKKHEVAKISTV